jgi:very-short-patch-repair endonuclease
MNGKSNTNEGWLSERLLFPKPTKRIKVRKPLRRSKKSIATKSAFKAFDNGKRCRRRSDAEVMLWAQEKRQERLSNPTPAEEAFEAILRSLGISYVREHIVQNGDQHVCLDFWLQTWSLCIELDGDGHRLQKRYDHQRSMWLARNFSIKTVRFWNSDVLSGTAEQRLREMLGLPR